MGLESESLSGLVVRRIDSMVGVYRVIGGL